MGNASAACTEAQFAESARQRCPEDTLTDRAASSTTCPSESESESVASPRGTYFGLLDTLSVSPAALNAWQPIHELRMQKNGSAIAEADECERQASALEACLESKFRRQERHLCTEERELQAQILVLADQAVHESDRREILLAELAERDTYSAELHGRCMDAEKSRSFAAADVANFSADLEKLRPEMLWAERYHEEAVSQRLKLESDVASAEQALKQRKKDLQTSEIVSHLLGYDLQREQRESQDYEEMEAQSACRWTGAVAAIQLEHQELRMQLMKQEHETQTAANDLNSLRSGAWRQRDVKEMPIFA